MPPRRPPQQPPEQPPPKFAPAEDPLLRETPERQREWYERLRLGREELVSRLALASALDPSQTTKLREQLFRKLHEQWQKEATQRYDRLRHTPVPELSPDALHPLTFLESMRDLSAVYGTAQFEEPIGSELERIMDGLGHDVPGEGEGVPDGAIFLKWVGTPEESRLTPNMTEVERARRALAGITPLNAQQAAVLTRLSQALETYVKNVDFIEGEIFENRPGKGKPEYIQHEVNTLGRAALFLTFAGGAIISGTITLFSKEKDLRLPAFYAGMATVVALGGRLTEGPLGRTIEQMSFLGKPPFQRLCREYRIGGNAWERVVENILTDPPEELTEALTKIQNGQDLTAEERERLLNALAGVPGTADGDAVREGLRRMSAIASHNLETGTNDLVELTTILQAAKASPEAQEMTLTYVREGAGVLGLQSLAETLKRQKEQRAQQRQRP